MLATDVSICFSLKRSHMANLVVLSSIYKSYLLFSYMICFLSSSSACGKHSSVTYLSNYLVGLVNAEVVFED